MNDKTTKTLIMNSARTLFLEKGYEHTPVEEICELAGMAKGTFFYYFETKQFLIKYLLDTQFGCMMEKIHKTLAECRNPAEKLTALVFTMLSTDALPPESAHYFKEQPEWFFKLYDDARYKYFYPLLAEILYDGADFGMFHIRKIEPVASILFLGINSFLHIYYQELIRDEKFKKEALEGIDELVSKALGLKPNVLKLSWM